MTKSYDFDLNFKKYTSDENIEATCKHFVDIFLKSKRMRYFSRNLIEKWKTSMIAKCAEILKGGDIENYQSKYRYATLKIAKHFKNVISFKNVDI